MARSHEGETKIEVTSFQWGMEDDTLVFEQSNSTVRPPSNVLYVATNDFRDDNGELDFAAADSSEEIGATVTYTYTVNTYPSAVEHHDYDLI